MHEQTRLSAQLLVVALLMCLKEGEQTVTLGQLHSRNLAPTPDLTRVFVEVLLSMGALEATSCCLAKVAELDDMILEPVELKGKSLGDAVASLWRSINYEVDTLRGIDHPTRCLIGLVEAGESVNYAEFYTRSNGAVLLDPKANNPWLRMMLAELSQKQVFSVLWRSIKKCIKDQKRSEESTEITFEHLCHQAYRYFLEYRHRGEDIKEYERPRVIPASSIAIVLARIKDLPMIHYHNG